MTPLEIAYASGGSDLIIDTIEATSSAWAAPLLICSGFEDRVCQTEDGRILLFKAIAFEEGLPVQDGSGFQNLLIALDNTDGKVQDNVETAKKADARVTLIKRRYLESNMEYPSSRYRLSLLDRTYEKNLASLTCGVYDLLGTSFPRGVLTANIAPGLIYI